MRNNYTIVVTLVYPPFNTYCQLHHYHHHHWAATVSSGWAKASACRLQLSLSCAVLCHIVSLQHLSRSSLHRFAGIPCRPFLSHGLEVVTHEVRRSSLNRLMCFAQDHFIFLTWLIMSHRQLTRNKFHASI